MSTSSYGSRASVKSTSSVRSNASGSSWFSIGSLSNFQGGKVTIDSNSFSKPLRVRRQSNLKLKLFSFDLAEQIGIESFDFLELRVTGSK